MAVKVETNCLDEEISKKQAVSKKGTENGFQMVKLCSFEKS